MFEVKNKFFADPAKKQFKFLIFSTLSRRKLNSSMTAPGPRNPNISGSSPITNANEHH